MWILFFLIFHLPTAQKLESKAQSLPHVYSSTSARLSLGFLRGNNGSFHSQPVVGPSEGERVEELGYNHGSFHGATTILRFHNRGMLDDGGDGGWKSPIV